MIKFYKYNLKALRKFNNTIQQFLVDISNNFKYRTLTVNSNKAFYCETDLGKLIIPSHKFNDIIYVNIKENRIYDKFIADLVVSYYLQSTTRGLIVDVGANIGQMSIYITKSIIDLKHDVTTMPFLISIEAEPFMHKLLSMNIENLGLLGTIEVHDKVVWSDKTQVNFPVPDFKNFSSWGSYGVAPKNIRNSRILETATLDSIIDGRKVSVIKLDIQGSELHALKGSLATINQSKPIIIFEFEHELSRNLGVNFKDYLDLIETMNYKIIDMKFPNFVIGPK